MTAENDNSSELNRSVEFDMPPEVLDEIRLNIEEIIATFPVPEDNKLDVIKKINFRDYVICSVVIVGGNAWNGSYDGALYWHSSHPLSDVGLSLGGRSLEITS